MEKMKKNIKIKNQNLKNEIMKMEAMLYKEKKFTPFYGSFRNIKPINNI